MIATNRRDRLRGAEAERRDTERELQRHHVDRDAGETHQAEQQEAERHRVVGQLGDDQRDEIERDARIELALAVLALREHERQFGDAQGAARGRHDIEQDLEALRGEPRRQLLEAFAPDHEEAAHRIGQA